MLFLVLDVFQIQSFALLFRVSGLHKDIKHLLSLEILHICPYKNLSYINAIVLGEIRWQLALLKIFPEGNLLSSSHLGFLQGHTGENNPMWTHEEAKLTRF